MRGLPRFFVLGVAVAGLGCNSILGNEAHQVVGAAGGTSGTGGRGGGAAGSAGGAGGAGGSATGAAGRGGGTAGTGGAGQAGTGGASGTSGTGGVGGTGGGTAGRGGTSGTGGVGGAGGTTGTAGTGGGLAGRGGTTGTAGTGGGIAGTGGTTGTGGRGGTTGAGGTGGVVVPRKLALLAGQLGGPGNIDGIGAAARFAGPYGIALDQSGNAFVADTANHTIRRVVLATGAVSTIAGAPGISGSADGAGAVARFKAPWGLAIDTSSGFSTLYIADSGNNLIRRLDVSQNRVTTMAGTAGPPGSTDATGTAARFNGPRAVLYDSTTSSVYVADAGNNTIRAIAIGTNAVTTLAGSATAQGLVDATGAAARFRLPADLAIDGFGNLYVADANNSAVRKVVLGTGVVTTLASGSPIAGPASIAYNGDIIATTQSSPTSLLRINTVTGATSTIMSLPETGVIRFDANNANLYMGLPYEVDKIDLTAKTISTIAGTTVHQDIANTGLLSAPYVIGSNGADLLFVNHSITYRLQQITVSTGAATTYLPPTCLGNFTGLANVRAGNLTAACASSNTIVNMTQTGSGLTTVAGSDFVAGSSDGTGTAAEFNSPQGLADDGAGTVYVADAGNHTIRKVVVATGVVTTLAGMAGTPGSADGTGLAASFSGPSAVASDGQGNLYVADAGNHTIRRIVISSRAVTTIAGTAGMAGTADGVGTAARFVGPTSIAADPAGNLFVSDGNTVRQIVLAGANVTTLVGVPGRAGVVLGDVPAGLNRPGGLVVLSSGAVVITEPLEHAVLILK